MEFDYYQQQVSTTDEKNNLLISVAGLVGEVGSIVSVYKNRKIFGGLNPQLRQEIGEELGDVLWYLSSIANNIGLSLNEVAEKNLAKAHSFFDEGQIQHFDAGYPADEQLPRLFEVEFTEREINKSVLVKISMNGVHIGDNLTDNSYDPDGYRYHDVFHLAYAAILGWSPVVRAILRRKRKSSPQVDEIEDGARAIAVEEAISIFIFNHATKKEFFADPSSIGLGLLQTIRQLAGYLEVKNCTAKQWRNAIVKGYEIFRLLRDARGGVVILDLDKGDISFRQKGTPQ